MIFSRSKSSVRCELDLEACFQTIFLRSIFWTASIFSQFSFFSWKYAIEFLKISIEPRIRSHFDLHHDYDILIIHEYIDSYTSMRQSSKNYEKSMNITMTWMIYYDFDFSMSISEKIIDEEKFQGN